jgi:1-acyl-sn-glycerol-3-phosphate acyltransferase
MNSANSNLRRKSEALAGAILRLVWGVKVSGELFIPTSQGLIVACNHVSLIDPVLLGVAIAPFRRPYFLAKKELFRQVALGWLLRSSGVIPLERGVADHSALRSALEILESGGALVIFPEGTRVKPGQVRAPKLGVSFLAQKSGASVLPVRVLGTGKFPREFPLEVRFGEPLLPPAAGREAAVAFAETVMNVIYSL